MTLPFNIHTAPGVFLGCCCDTICTVAMETDGGVHGDQPLYECLGETVLSLGTRTLEGELVRCVRTGRRERGSHTKRCDLEMLRSL